MQQRSSEQWYQREELGQVTFRWVAEERKQPRGLVVLPENLGRTETSLWTSLSITVTHRGPLAC